MKGKPEVPSRPPDSGSYLVYCSPEALFRAEHESLVRVLSVAAGGDLEDARDAVQEAFVQLCVDWSRMSRYQDPVSWVRRVALNRLSNQQRSRRRWRNALLRLGSRGEERAAADTAVVSKTSQADSEVLRLLRPLPERQRVAMADASMLTAVYLRQDLGLTFVNHVRTARGWAPVSYYVGAAHDEWGIGGHLLGWDRAGSASLFDYEVPEGAGTDTQPPGHYLVRLPAQSDIRGTASPADSWMRSFLQEPPLPGPVLAVSVAGSLPATGPISGASPSTSQAGPPPGSAAQIETLLGFIRPERTSGDVFLPVPHLSPHEQPGFANGSQGARAGYRINYEVDVDADRWVTVGVDFKELTDAYLGLKAESRLTPTGISFDGNEWQQGTNSDGDVILGVEVPATDSADPYVLTIRVKTIDTALGMEVAGSMKRFANP